MLDSVTSGRSYPALRLQFDVPVEVVEPGIVQVVRRKFPSLLLQLERGWPVRAMAWVHADVMR